METEAILGGPLKKDTPQLHTMQRRRNLLTGLVYLSISYVSDPDEILATRLLCLY